MGSNKYVVTFTVMLAKHYINAINWKYLGHEESLLKQLSINELCESTFY